jgi:hypothetical protein
MSKFIPQTFNDFLAIILVVLFIAYIAVTSAFNWDNKVVDLAAGVFLAKLSDVVQFYYRKSKEEK